MKEIIIIDNNRQGSEAIKLRQKIKDLLNKIDLSYQMYEVLSEEERYKRDWELAAKDKTRQKEISLWDQAQEEDDETNKDWEWK